MSLWRASILSAACVVALGSAPLGAEATPVGDFGSPVPLPELPELVYSIETDKQVYQLGEQVRVTHRAVNQGEVDIRFEFLYSPAFQFYILAAEERIDPWFEARSPVIWGFTLSPGDSYVTEWTWEITDADGSPLPPGHYDIVGIGNGGPSPIVVGAHYPVPPITSITVVPEPGILGFVALGFGLLPRRKALCKDDE